jgi:hypothetical protein
LELDAGVIIRNKQKEANFANDQVINPMSHNPGPTGPPSGEILRKIVLDAIDTSRPSVFCNLYKTVE